MFYKTVQKDLDRFFEEDGLLDHGVYFRSLSSDIVDCELFIKDNLILAGLPYFFEAFNFLLDEKITYDKFLECEGKNFSKGEDSHIKFSLPFNAALTGERIALNLLSHASSIASYTNKFSTLAKPSGIKILDTRKTTPGLRNLEKYAVTLGGGFNHRYNQTDIFMIKDNHKSFYGGLKQAIGYFSSLKSFYKPVVVEIHNLDELNEAIELAVKHVMLDNFSPEDVKKAVKMKPAHMTYEVSGGMNLEKIQDYLIEGVDAVSVGSLTYGAPSVDLSFKYKRR